MIEQMQEHRKLAAIMFTDMVGYSSIAQQNESLALALLDEQRQLLRSLFPAFGGREIETAGDAFFVEFASALNAVECAVEIQKQLHARNETAPQERRIRLRIGLHVGDVVVRGSSVLGDGVNIAARLEPLAPPEGICLSEDVARQIRNKTTLPLRRLGKAELKNIQLPLEIFTVELPWSEIPPPLAPSEIVLNNLPPQSTPFIGRGEEVAAVTQMLMKETHRLVTLTGPGGTGKTRLGVQVARLMAPQFRNGVCMVGLATVNDAALVVAEIAKALGVRDTGTKSLHELVEDFLRTLHLLLFLDNFEQVISAATGIGQLLDRCPSLKVIVTSREPLHLSAEQEFFVPPLNLPDLKKLPPLESLSQYAAVELFVQRALAVKPDFSVTNENAPAVAEICHRLDGLPLAIELAAARIKLLTPQAILARLGGGLELLQGGARDKPARHQTLRQAIAWSYDLLDADEKALFRRLAIFLGGCSLDAAEHICAGEERSAGAVFEGIALLVDKSLVRQEQPSDGEPRFSMLETIREFAFEMLAQCGELDATRRLHARYFLTLAENAEPQLTGPHQRRWLDRLEHEHDNFRSLLQWAEEAGHVETGLRLAGALWRFWIIRGYMGEGRDRLHALLSHPGPVSDARVRAKALNGAGTIAHESGDYTLARQYLEESLRLWRAIGDTKGIATVLNNLSYVEGLVGEIQMSRSLSEESLALHKELNDKRGVAVALHNIAWIARPQLSFAEQIALFRQSLDLRNEIGDERGAAYMMINIAYVHRFLGEYDKAIPLLEQAEELLAGIGDKQIPGWGWYVLGEIERDRGNLERAAKLVTDALMQMDHVGNKFASIQSCARLAGIRLRQGRTGEAKVLLDKSLAAFRAVGLKWGFAEVLCDRSLVALEEADIAGAIALLKECIACCRASDDRFGAVGALECFARIAAREKNYDRVALLLGVTGAGRHHLGTPIPPGDRPVFDSLRTAALAALGSDAFNETLGRGMTMSLDDGIRLVLDSPARETMEGPPAHSI